MKSNSNTANKKMKSILQCPKCNKSLAKFQDKKIYKCADNHCYDIAKQGYINLLLSHHKKSNHSGDSKDMIRIRHNFLEKGYYQPISDEINKLALEYVKKSRCHILDLGCGEGYYLHKLREAFALQQRNNMYYGLDISKEAVKLAGSRSKSIEWLVASSFKIPFKRESIELLLSVFSPISDDECFRILDRQGYFIRVLPNASHLIELRKIIYSHLEERREGTIFNKNMECIKEKDVTYQIYLEQDELISLLKMTPHYWKTSYDNKKKLEEISRMEVTIDMNVAVFHKEQAIPKAGEETNHVK